MGRLVLAGVVALLIALPAGAGVAGAREHADRGDGLGRAGAGTSTAVAINTADNSLMFKLSFAIFTVTGNVVDNLNVAAAYASCDHCETVAISIQTLLVESAASIVAPINEASARNQNCDQCDTAAVAYQFVVAAGTKLEFTPEGRREVAYIRRQLERLRREARHGMTGSEILAAVATLMNQYAGVLSNDLVPASSPGAGDHRADGSIQTPSSVTASSNGQDPTVPAPEPAASSVTDPSVATTTSTTPASANPGSTTSPSTTTTNATSSTTTGTTTTTPASATTTSTTPATTTTSGVTTTPSAATTPTGTTTTPSSSTTP